MAMIYGALIVIVVTVLLGVLGLLPLSPFTEIQNRLDSDLLGHINYFMPIEPMLSVGLGWLTAIGLYYTYTVILRWVRAIR